MSLSVIRKITPVWLLWLVTLAVCGASPFDGRIVGGYEASITQFPSQVSVQLLNSHICGGSLIRNNMVVTAAHCVVPFTVAALYTVRLGSSYHNKGGIVVPVAATAVHENYENNTNDIAILKLWRSVTYSANIQPIILVEDYVVEPNEEYTVCGWGTQKSNGSKLSPVLLCTEVNNVPLDECQKAYNGIADINDKMVCAGVPEGGRDSCQGDSGGPLTLSHNNVRNLVGLVSFGLGCGDAKYAGVYASIQKLRPWVENKINEWS